MDIIDVEGLRKHILLFDAGIDILLNHLPRIGLLCEAGITESVTDRLELRRELRAQLVKQLDALRVAQQRAAGRVEVGAKVRCARRGTP